MSKCRYVYTLLILCGLLTVNGFTPSVSLKYSLKTMTSATSISLRPPTGTISRSQHGRKDTFKNNRAVLVRHGRLPTTALNGLFGLGAPEIVIILIAAAFVLGPQKLAELGKDAGKIAGELKEVPKEFQAGLIEGEKQAKAMKEESSTTLTTVETVRQEDATMKKE